MKKLFVLAFAMIMSIAFAGTLSGVVTDSETGDAIEGAMVRLMGGCTPQVKGGGGCGGGGCGGNGGQGGGHGHGGGHGQGGGCGQNVFIAETDANGFYEIVDIPEGIYDVKANKHFGAYMPVVIEEVEIIGDVTLDIELEGKVCNTRADFSIK